MFGVGRQGLIGQTQTKSSERSVCVRANNGGSGIDSKMKYRGLLPGPGEKRRSRCHPLLVLPEILGVKPWYRDRRIHE